MSRSDLEILEDMKKVLANGWNKGSYCWGDSYCVLGAFARVKEGLVLEDQISKYYSCHGPYGPHKPHPLVSKMDTLAEKLGFGGTPDLNDDEQTTLEDVMRFLDMLIEEELSSVKVPEVKEIPVDKEKSNA